MREEEIREIGKSLLLFNKKIREMGLGCKQWFYAIFDFSELEFLEGENHGFTFFATDDSVKATMVNEYPVYNGFKFNKPPISVVAWGKYKDYSEEKETRFVAFYLVLNVDFALEIFVYDEVYLED